MSLILADLTDNFFAFTVTGKVFHGYAEQSTPC